MNKRIFDVVIAMIVLMIALIPMAIVALLIRRYLGTPILFTQQRPGLAGRPFMVYKFRTMTDERDENGKLLPDEVRLTRFGLFLRRTSLDELPQLFNVIRGDISLVGPRPLLMEYMPLYSKEQARRHEVKPGITGWAQINGRNAISWEEKFKLDVWYVDHQSFLVDMKILFLTFKKVIAKENINAQGAVNMPKFTGSQAAENK